MSPAPADDDQQFSFVIQLFRHPRIRNDIVALADHAQPGFQEKLRILARNPGLFLAVVPVIFTAAQDQCGGQWRKQFHSSQRSTRRIACRPYRRFRQPDPVISGRNQPRHVGKRSEHFGRSAIGRRVQQINHAVAVKHTQSQCTVTLIPDEFHRYATGFCSVPMGSMVMAT